MNRYIIPCAAAAVLFVAAEPWASAGNNPMSMSSDTSSTHNSPAQVGTPPKADITHFQSVKLSLTDAIHSAQQQHKGKAVAARFEMWNGQPSYFVRTAAHDKIWEGRINADSGQMIGQAKTYTDQELTRDLRQQADAVRNIHTSLTQAVKDAEQQQGGKAILARVRWDSNGKASYDVDVVKNGQLHTAMVDAKTGKVG